MPWIESHQELRNHPKTKRLARELKITVAAAIGHLHCLWWWATDYAPDGDLTEYEAWEIADAAYYEGKNTEKFKDALIFAGFLDNTNGRLILHDWNDYGGKNLNRQKKATERVQRYRERQRAVQQQCNANETEQSRTVSGQTEGNAQECNGNVTVTQALQNANETQKKRKRNCVTGHDMTRQDITGQESTGKENTDTPHTPQRGEAWGRTDSPHCRNGGSQNSGRFIRGRRGKERLRKPGIKSDRPQNCMRPSWQRLKRTWTATHSGTGTTGSTSRIPPHG